MRQCPHSTHAAWARKHWQFMPLALSSNRAEKVSFTTFDSATQKAKTNNESPQIKIHSAFLVARKSNHNDSLGTAITGNFQKLSPALGR